MVEQVCVSNYDQKFGAYELIRRPIFQNCQLEDGGQMGKNVSQEMRPYFGDLRCKRCEMRIRELKANSCWKCAQLTYKCCFEIEILDFDFLEFTAIIESSTSFFDSALFKLNDNNMPFNNCAFLKSTQEALESYCQARIVTFI